MVIATKAWIAIDGATGAAAVGLTRQGVIAALPPGSRTVAVGAVTVWQLMRLAMRPNPAPIQFEAVRIADYEVPTGSVVPVRGNLRREVTSWSRG
jgi:hypothetical protein